METSVNLELYSTNLFSALNFHMKQQICYCAIWTFSVPRNWSHSLGFRRTFCYKNKWCKIQENDSDEQKVRKGFDRQQQWPEPRAKNRWWGWFCGCCQTCFFGIIWLNGRGLKQTHKLDRGELMLKFLPPLSPLYDHVCGGKKQRPEKPH